MAHHLHTKKAIRQTARRKRRNQTDRSKMKTAIKNFIAADSTDSKATALRIAQTMIDRAAKKNVIHDNAAAHKKSHLAKAYNAFVRSHA